VNFILVQPHQVTNLMKSRHFLAYIHKPLLRINLLENLEAPPGRVLFPPLGGIIMFAETISNEYYLKVVKQFIDKEITQSRVWKIVISKNYLDNCINASYENDRLLNELGARNIIEIVPSDPRHQTIERIEFPDTFNESEIQEVKKLSAVSLNVAKKYANKYKEKYRHFLLLTNEVKEIKVPFYGVEILHFKNEFMKYFSDANREDPLKRVLPIIENIPVDEYIKNEIKNEFKIKQNLKREKDIKQQSTKQEKTNEQKRIEEEKKTN